MRRGLNRIVVITMATAAAALVTNAASAAEDQSAVSTVLNPSSRYEIVQSELAARQTFRVDKTCGAVSQLVVDNEGQNHWQAMPVEARHSCTADGRVRYQLFMSGLAAKFTFLMNTDTGTTWQLVTDSQQSLSWQILQ